MVLFRCDGNRECVGWGVIASAIIGVITALLRITGIIATTPAFLWVVFGVAVGYLAVLLATYLLREQPVACSGSGLSALLTGILGSILLSVVLLAIPFAATSIVGAVLVGLLLLFFSLIFTASACLVKCRASA